MVTFTPYILRYNFGADPVTQNETFSHLFMSFAHE